MHTEYHTRYTSRATENVLRTIDETRNLYPNSRVLVDTLSTLVKNPRLRDSTAALNAAIEKKCCQTPELSIIDSRYLPFRDSIHFSQASKKELASLIMQNIHYN